MKTSIFILVLVTTSLFCLAWGQNQLPEGPWRAIVFNETDMPKLHWEGNVSVKLWGNYSATDSLMVINSMNLFNELCETINLEIATLDRGNLEIYFMDSINRETYKGIIQIGANQDRWWYTLSSTLRQKQSIQFRYYQQEL